MEIEQLEQRLKNLPPVSEVRGYDLAKLESLASDVSKLSSDIDRELARQEAFYKNAEEEEKTLRQKIKDEFGCVIDGRFLLFSHGVMFYTWAAGISTSTADE